LFYGAYNVKVELIFRIIGMLALAALGVYWGIRFSEIFDIQILLASIVLGLAGAAIGFLFTPYVTTRPAITIRNNLTRISTRTLVAGLVGLLAGLIVAALSAYPLSLLPTPFGDLFPFIGLLVFSYFGIMIFVMRQDDIFAVLRHLPGRSSAADDKPDAAADSPDSLRRQRGRRGMEVLSQLQKDDTVPVEISDIDVEGIREVDEKLVVLARQLSCPIMTNDYNLNRVAELQGVSVLNVNELANAVKSVFLPGEELVVDIIQKGREAGQGIAYLDDGTMIVVEDGRDRINTQASVTVTKVLQTAAGRMIFSRLDEET
jgi:uncharacterized protein YacL